MVDERKEVRGFTFMELGIAAVKGDPEVLVPVPDSGGAQLLPPEPPESASSDSPLPAPSEAPPIPADRTESAPPESTSTEAAKDAAEIALPIPADAERDMEAAGTRSDS